MSHEKDFKIDDFIRRVEKHISNAEENITKLEDYQPISDAQDLHEYHEENLQWNIEMVFLELRFALETLSYPELLADLKEGFKSFHGKLTSLHSVSYVGVMFCPALSYLQQYFEVLSALGSRTGELELHRDLALLERILSGTSKIILDRRLTPSNEAQIRQAVLDLLIHVFPDTVREVPIPKIAKTYKPDIGIRSLKAAVEYKFVDSETDLKACIGGILEDVGGYAGSTDWVRFFAVIYMTDSFMTVQQMEAEFRLAGVEPNWRIILVTGRGQRKKKGEAEAAQGHNQALPLTGVVVTAPAPFEAPSPPVHAGAAPAPPGAEL